MIIGASAIAQIIQAISCVAIGFLGGAIWLMIEQLPMVKVLRAIADAVLCLAITCAFLFVIQNLNKGEILIFHPLSVLAGFFFAWKLFPRLVPKFASPQTPKVFVSKRTQKRLQNPDAEIEDFLFVAALKRTYHKFSKALGLTKKKLIASYAKVPALLKTRLVARNGKKPKKSLLPKKENAAEQFILASFKKNAIKKPSN
ncbi:MAG: hypothetical protein PHE93_02730 [Clostridia bacterium]|nr:hypothetical protein [Clostridia bacterium]